MSLRSTLLRPAPERTEPVPWCVHYQLQYMWQRLLLLNRRLQLEAATAAAWLGHIGEMKGHLIAELAIDSQMQWRRENSSMHAYSF
jgi:hypothetical protein